MSQPKEWYVLAVADTGAELIRCTEADYEPVALAAKVASPLTGELDNIVSADVAQTGGRYVPTSDGERAGQQVPRATFTNNNVETRGAFTEQYLASLGDAVRDQVDTENTPLLVAMDEARFALFQTVSGLSEVAQPLDMTANTSSTAQLWELSRQRIRERAAS